MVELANIAGQVFHTQNSSELTVNLTQLLTHIVMLLNHAAHMSFMAD